MAEEAFALSPINARPNVPGEADYEAIREAFMETARGRWFLAEYTKRNRNADTNLLLEAVARLEGNLAVQKQQPQGLSLTAALGAIRTALRQAKATAIEVLPRGDDSDIQTASRNGARIVREIAWTLRECGADARICDLLDTQVKAIETGHETVQAQNSENGREAVLASYDALMERIEALADGSVTPTASAEAPVTERTAEPREASVTPLFKAPASEPVAEAPVGTPAKPKPAFKSAAVEDALAAAEALVEAAEAMGQSPSLLPAEAAVATDMNFEVEADEAEADEAKDLAVLDAVAMEMGALDLDETDELFEPAPEKMANEAAYAAPSEPAYQTPVSETPVADEMTLAEIAQAALAPELPPAPASTLGAALIANGVIANPAASASDALAPIRRMTQAEKIAFFS